MDKILAKHLDVIDEFEKQIDIVIEQEYSQLDIDYVMAHPQEALMEVAQNIRDIFEERYMPDAIEEGRQLALRVEAQIEADKTIKVDDTSDPKANADR